MDTVLSSVQLVRLLAQPERRRVAAALILNEGASDVESLALASGLPVRSVVEAADRLVSGGLVSEQGGQFALIDEAFQAAARSEAPPSPSSEHNDQPIDIARVLDIAFRDGRLVQWPAKRTKRLIVLDYLAQQFEIGKRYKEAEVNAKLRDFNDDVATSRRYLVDEQFLDRGNGEYWRCGGSI